MNNESDQLMEKLPNYQNTGFGSHPLKGNVKPSVDTISKEEYLERRAKVRTCIVSQEERKVSKRQ